MHSIVVFNLSITDYRNVSHIRRIIYTPVCPLKKGVCLICDWKTCELVSQKLNFTDILLSSLSPCALYARLYGIHVTHCNWFLSFDFKCFNFSVFPLNPIRIKWMDLILLQSLDQLCCSNQTHLLNPIWTSALQTQKWMSSTISSISTHVCLG